MNTTHVFARTCRAEWIRLWTVKGSWWFAIAATVAMVGLGLIAGDDAANDLVPPRGEPDWVAPSIAALPTQLALNALALSAVTADYALYRPAWCRGCHASSVGTPAPRAREASASSAGPA